MNTTPTDLEQMREQLLRKAFNKVSHDLKTPLACVIGSLETLDPLTKTALAEAQRLDVLFAAMLDKVKPE